MTWHPVYLDSVLEPDYAHAHHYLLPYFLDALLAHARGLLKVGTPHALEAVQAVRELQDFVPPAYDPAVEDLFFTLDRELAGRSAVGAGALRTALSRNDLDMTVYRLNARAHLQDALADLAGLRRVLLDLAAREAGTLMVAFTHHQPAQPSTLGHYLCAAENMLARDTARLHGAMERLNVSPLGGVALAGSSHPLDREFTARLLGFGGPVENTFEAVAASDWQLELAGTVSLCAVNLSRVLYDLLAWAGQGLITLAAGLVQGSSVMPQKRNPVALEHARTRFSKVLGYAQAVTASNHNVPYGDVNDVGTDVLEPMQLLWRDFSQGLRLLSAALEQPGVARQQWRAAAEASESTLTELADTLARQTGDFRQAHAAAQALLRALHAEGRSLNAATDADLRALGLDVPDGTVQAALNPDEFVARRTTQGGPAPAPMQAQLDSARERLTRDLGVQTGWADRFSRCRRHLWADPDASSRPPSSRKEIP